MKIGIASGVYLNYPFAEAIKRVAAAGYDSIDAWSGRPHTYRGDYSTKDLLHLQQLIEENGLVMSSFLPAFYRYPYYPPSQSIACCLEMLICIPGN